MQVLIAISGFCPRIVNVPCTTPFDFLFIISIHVPAWGTTLTSILLPMTDTFQSTFPRGERPALFASYISWSYFNPRSRVGNDYVDLVVLKQTMFISIHVPAWGTTYRRLWWDHGSCRFQSTFPRGERLVQTEQLSQKCHFNPRSRVGNDGLPMSDYLNKYISIHVPAWGTTFCGVWMHGTQKFQSTFPRGERQRTGCWV